MALPPWAKWKGECPGRESCPPSVLPSFLSFFLSPIFFSPLSTRVHTLLHHVTPFWILHYDYFAWKTQITKKKLRRSKKIILQCIKNSLILWENVQHEYIAIPQEYIMNSWKEKKKKRNKEEEKKKW